jgi:cytochrome P450
MTDTERCPVDDLATDYDIFDPDYVRDPVPAWTELRGTCPIAHTERYGGSWLPTRYEDVQAMAKMVPELSSISPVVINLPDDLIGDDHEGYNAAAPISADPPIQTWTRRLLLPHFTPKAIEPLRGYTEQLCHELIDRFVDDGGCDGAVDYAQQIPPRLIARKLGVDESMVDQFIEWVRGALELGLQDPELRVRCRNAIRGFFRSEIADRRTNPKDDLITALLNSEIDGEPIPEAMVVGMCNLQLVAGIDTTWSSIGSAIWHFAGHADDRRRMAEADDTLWDTAIEELLRVYSPVTMARDAIEDVEFGGVTFAKGDKILMNFPGANHDPEAFDDPDTVILDRQRNRHIAFGSGIHRCAGSNLARMEMEISLKVWFSRIPEFTLGDPDAVTWAGGQVRGPRTLPITFG